MEQPLQTKLKRKILKHKFFTTGYVFIYSILIVCFDAFTFSRDSLDLLDFEVLSLRLVVVFSYWMTVKNLSGLAERRGLSYLVVMLLCIVGIPLIAGGILCLILGK